MSKKKSIKMRFNATERRSIVKFTNGVPNPKAKFRVQQYMKSDDNTKKLLHVQTSHIGYFGYNDNESQDYKYLVVEHEEESNTAHYFEADCFEMNPLLPCHMPEHLQESDDDGVDERTDQQKKADLTRDFGSHKNKMMLKKKEKHDGADNTVALSNAATAVTENINEEKLSMALASNEGAGKQSLLPCNIKADDLRHVYGVFSGELIPKEVMESLGRQYTEKLIMVVKQHGETQEKAIINEKAVREEKFEDYVKTLLLKSIGEDEDVSVSRRVVCCKLVSIMIRLYKIRASEVRKQTCFADEQEDVRKWILSNFFVGEKRNRQMPKKFKDKALGMAIVLVWSCFKFSFPAEEMEAAFNISPKDFSIITKCLFGKVITVKSHNMRKCMITFPLKFPNNYKIRK